MKVQRLEATVGGSTQLHEERGFAGHHDLDPCWSRWSKGEWSAIAVRGRFVYHPMISEGDVRRTMVSELT